MKCTECKGDGQVGMQHDGQPIVCERCNGSGAEPSPAERKQRELERFEEFFGPLDEDDLDGTPSLYDPHYEWASGLGPEAFTNGC